MLSWKELAHLFTVIIPKAGLTQVLRFWLMDSCARSSTGNSSLTQVLSWKELVLSFTVFIPKDALTQVLSWNKLVLLFTVIIPKPG